jgi:hypothetical protein
MVAIHLDKNVREGLKKEQVKPSSFDIALSRDTYAFGETINLRVECNNEQSSVDLKTIKFKLYLCFSQKRN